MVYLNHAGTSWPKPRCVIEAVRQATERQPSNWSAQFHDDFQSVADFFHVEQSRLLLTPSCTTALNLAIQDHDWRPGDRVLTSHFEHHALQRNLDQLQRLGVAVETLPWTDSELIDMERMREELRKGKVRLTAITAACNVTGRLLPFRQVIELAHEFGVLVLLDGAQIGGWWDLDLTELGADLFTFAGHKGLRAPWGIGGLYVSPRTTMHCSQASCSISQQGNEDSAIMPGYCDAGSVNLVALAGLAAGCRWLSEPAQAGRLERSRELSERFSEQCRQAPGIRILHERPMSQKMPTVALQCSRQSHDEVAWELKRRDVVVSSGFQCAPRAHIALGTQERGVLRFSFAWDTSREAVDRAAECLTSTLKR